MNGVRENAEQRLSIHRPPRKSPAWTQADALKGIGWALLDLADAVRELKTDRTVNEIRLSHGLPPAPPQPPTPGVNPATGQPARSDARPDPRSR